MISKLQYITQDISEKTHAELAAEACSYGINWVQFRSKKTFASELQAHAEACMKFCRNFNARFIVNDYVWLAKELNADGVHLGKSDMSPAEARKILGSGFIIGATANTLEDIIFLNKQGVDYIGLGPFRFTETKKNLSPVIGIEGYNRILKLCKENNIGTPVIAIGGISVGDVKDILKTGVHGIAVSSEITKSIDKQKTIFELLKETSCLD